MLTENYNGWCCARVEPIFALNRRLDWQTCLYKGVLKFLFKLNDLSEQGVTFESKIPFLSVANRPSSPFSNVLKCGRQRAGLGGQHCKRGFENARFCSQKHLSFKAYRDTRFTFEHERPCFPNTTSSHGRSHRLSIRERCNMYQLKRTGLLLARSYEIMPEIDAEHV